MSIKLTDTNDDSKVVDLKHERIRKLDERERQLDEREDKLDTREQRYIRRRLAVIAQTLSQAAWDPTANITDAIDAALVELKEIRALLRSQADRRRLHADAETVLGRE